ncbi:MAG TPA: hypothetical protein VKU80_14615 [Planctomycetota bacterium]|nr:hypothetical protein [Planctomycetota bacterium]
MFLMMIASILAIVVPILMSVFVPAIPPFLTPGAPYSGSKQDGD